MSVDSSPLFIPSPPATQRISRNLDGEVEDLVDKAKRVQKLSTAVENFLNARQGCFLEAFSRQIDLIKSRSPEFHEGRVTIFDKTLLILTEHPACLTTPAAVHFYCEEFLNIDLGGPATEVERTLQRTVQVPQDLKQALPSSSDSTIIEAEADSEAKKLRRLSPMDPDLRKDMEPRLGALWSVYEVARADYLLALDNSNLEKKISTAKFLRDTAENILQHLENKTCDPLMKVELQGTFAHAKMTAVGLTGGKNRKFDKAEIERMKGIPRGPSRPAQRKAQAGKFKHPQPQMLHGQGSGMTTRYRPGVLGSGLGHVHTEQMRYPEQDARRERSPYVDEQPALPYRLDPRGNYSYAEGGASQRETAPGFGHYHQRESYSRSEDRPRTEQGHRQLTPESDRRRGSSSHRYERSASPGPASRMTREGDRGSRNTDCLRERGGRGDSYVPGSRSHWSPFSGREQARRGSVGGEERMRGRGHSDEPFGYSRTVDSYKPKY